MKKKFKNGWIPDEHDDRDFTIYHEQIAPLLKRLNLEKAERIKFPDCFDLKKWFSPVESQGNLGSCTACSGVGLIEYYERRIFNNYINASRLFLYKTTRNLIKIKDGKEYDQAMKEIKDTGVTLRATMKAMVMLGVPPEKYWPYNEKKVNIEPPALCYALADNYKTHSYLRLDGIEKEDKEKLLQRIKFFLYKGIPSMFGCDMGFSLFRDDGMISYPGKDIKFDKKHAMVAVGYDDKTEIIDTITNNKTRGALIVRNSMGEQWGDKGYGWLPYDYILDGHANDWWVLIKMDWVDELKFELKQNK